MQPYKTIGIVEFASNSDGNLNQVATQKFMGFIQNAQPEVRFLELGPEDQLLKKLGLDSLDSRNIHSPKVKELMRRFDCVHDPDIETEFPRKWPAKVEIATREGQRFITRLELSERRPGKPLDMG